MFVDILPRRHDQDDDDADAVVAQSARHAGVHFAGPQERQTERGEPDRLPQKGIYYSCPFLI